MAILRLLGAVRRVTGLRSLAFMHSAHIRTFCSAVPSLCGSRNSGLRFGFPLSSNNLRCLCQSTSHVTLDGSPKNKFSHEEQVQEETKGVKWSQPLSRKKANVRFICRKCGFQHLQWAGWCQECESSNTIEKETVASKALGGGPGMEAARQQPPKYGWLPSDPNCRPQRLKDLASGVGGTWRIPISGGIGKELGRVLGGGLVPGSLVLVGGDPGVGKSTLLMQVAALLVVGDDNPNREDDVLYVSGEESAEQIASRALRLDVSRNLYLYATNVLEDVIDYITYLRPRAAIVDSIQTVYLKAATGTIGSLNQVRECAMALLQLSKSMNIPIIMVGHVTKSGDIAGPRVLEHIVDVVLYVEGEASHIHRLVRPVKNRFGSTEELGVLQMSPSGLQPVLNPILLYATKSESDEHVPVGSAFTVIVDGSRPFLAETQALCSVGGGCRRYVGVETKRVDMIIAVLTKQVGLPLDNSTIFLNVVGGAQVKEPVGDLAIAVSICSSYFEKSVPCGMSFLGEIGLGGELRSTTMMQKRVHELSNLCFAKCIVPEVCATSYRNEGGDGFSVIGYKNVQSVIKDVFNVEF